MVKVMKIIKHISFLEIMKLLKTIKKQELSPFISFKYNNSSIEITYYKNWLIDMKI